MLWLSKKRIKRTKLQFLHFKGCPEMSNSLPLKTYAQVTLLLLFPYMVQKQLPLILLEQSRKKKILENVECS